LTAIGDAAARQVVRRQLDIDVVSRRDPDAKAPEPPGQTGQDRVTIFELDLERRAGKRFDDAADQTQRIFFLDGCEGLAAFLAAAPPSTRWWNTGSLFVEERFRS
jgi:hypothetical protein